MSKVNACIVIFSLVLFFSTSIAADVEKDVLVGLKKVGSLEGRINANQIINAYGRDKTRLVDLQREGDFSPALQVFLDSRKHPSFIAEISHKIRKWGIYRIQIYDERFKTKDGIGVGSSIKYLKKVYGDIQVVQGEIGLIVIDEKNKISYVLDSKSVPQKYWSTGKTSDIPDTTTVASLLVIFR